MEIKELALAEIGMASQIRFPNLAFVGGGGGSIGAFFYFERIFKYANNRENSIMRTYHLV